MMRKKDFENMFGDLDQELKDLNQKQLDIIASRVREELEARDKEK